MNSATLEKLIKQLQEKEPETTTESLRTSPPTVRRSKEDRMKDWEGNIDTLDIEKTFALMDTMTQFVPEKFAKVSKTQPTTLTVEELIKLMDEFLAMSQINDALDSRRAQIKTMFFNHLNVKNELEGVEDPANVNGEENIYSFGKRFVREGCGVTDPTLNEDTLAGLLKEVLSPEEYQKVFTEEVEVVKTRVLNTDVLADLIGSSAVTRESVKKSLVKGRPKTAKFTVRDIRKEN